MSNSPGFRGGNISSAVPNSFSSSPNSGTLFQRTCHSALVNCVLPSSSIDLSLSRKVAKPLVAVFGSLITDPTAVTTRGRLPSSAASCRPSVFSVRKLCRRKNASATKAYVASSLGQQMTAILQTLKTAAAAASAMDGSGKISAARIPATAMSAKPRNGWRGAVTSFIIALFVDTGFPRQAVIRVKILKLSDTTQPTCHPKRSEEPPIEVNVTQRLFCDG